MEPRLIFEAHAIDTYESLRAPIRRRTEGLADMLADGLHALRHGSPDVTAEFIDRAIADLRKLGADTAPSGKFDAYPAVTR